MGHSLGVRRSSVYCTPYDAGEIGRQTQDVPWAPPLFTHLEKTMSQVKMSVLDLTSVTHRMAQAIRCQERRQQWQSPSLQEEQREWKMSAAGCTLSSACCLYFLEFYHRELRLNWFLATLCLPLHFLARCFGCCLANRQSKYRDEEIPPD